MSKVLTQEDKNFIIGILKNIESIYYKELMLKNEQITKNLQKTFYENNKKLQKEIEEDREDFLYDWYDLCNYSNFLKYFIFYENHLSDFIFNPYKYYIKNEHLASNFLINESEKIEINSIYNKLLEKNKKIVNRYGIIKETVIDYEVLEKEFNIEMNNRYNLENKIYLLYKIQYWVNKYGINLKSEEFLSNQNYNIKSLINYEKYFIFNSDDEFSKLRDKQLIDIDLSWNRLLYQVYHKSTWEDIDAFLGKFLSPSWGNMNERFKCLEILY